jgi:diguanylate cyclase (GGDEF)-like protein
VSVTRSGLGLVAALAVAALLPLALATLAFGSAFRSSETDRIDSRLTAAVQAAGDRAAATDAEALSRARALANERRVQVAMLRHDTAALAAEVIRIPFATISAAGTANAVRPPPGTVRHEITVVSNGERVGVVRADVALGRLVARAARDSGVEGAVAVTGRAVTGDLSGLPAAGAAGVASWATRGQTVYRSLHGPLLDGRSVVAAVPRRSIDSAVRDRQWRIAAAGILTVVAVGLAALLLLLRRRGVSGSAYRTRSPMALLGDVVAAADDPRGLLPVLLETAVGAVDAAGGYAVWDGDRIAEAGVEPPTSRPLTLELDPDAPAGERQIVLFPRRGAFSPEEREIATSLVVEGRIALENARLHNIVRRQAVTDELTDLANRRRFMEVLQQEDARARRFDLALGLILFDLDHFKQINDRFGHQAGDEVLRRVADVVRERVRETDLPARVGGEEFAVILSGTDSSGAAALAENLRGDLSTLVHVRGGRHWRVTASFGVADLGPESGLEELIAGADRALYHAKAEGRDRVSLEPLAPR